MNVDDSWLFEYRVLSVYFLRMIVFVKRIDCLSSLEMSYHFLVNFRFVKGELIGNRVVPSQFLVTSVING